MKRYWRLWLMLGFYSHLAYVEVEIQNLDGILFARVFGQTDICSLKSTLENLDLSYLLDEFGSIVCRPNSTCQISLNSNETFFVKKNNLFFEAKIGDLKHYRSEYKPFQSSDDKVRIWCDPNEGLLYKDALEKKYLRKPECYVAVSVK